MCFLNHSEIKLCVCVCWAYACAHVCVCVWGRCMCWVYTYMHACRGQRRTLGVSSSIAFQFIFCDQVSHQPNFRKTGWQLLRSDLSPCATLGYRHAQKCLVYRGDGVLNSHYLYNKCPDLCNKHLPQSHLLNPETTYS